MLDYGGRTSTLNWAAAGSLCKTQLELGALEIGRARGHESRLLAGVASSSQVWGDQLLFSSLLYPVNLILLLVPITWSGRREKGCSYRGRWTCRGPTWRGRRESSGPGWCHCRQAQTKHSQWRWEGLCILLDTGEVATILKSQVKQGWVAGCFVGM